MMTVEIFHEHNQMSGYIIKLANILATGLPTVHDLLHTTEGFVVEKLCWWVGVLAVTYLGAMF